MTRHPRSRDEDTPSPDPLREAEASLRGKNEPGITVGGWTLRWAGDCWAVGQWRDSKSGEPWWAQASWHGRLDQALRKLLDRNTEGGVTELAEAVERVERASRQIMIALRYNIMK